MTLLRRSGGSSTSAELARRGLRGQPLALLPGVMDEGEVGSPVAWASSAWDSESASSDRSDSTLLHDLARALPKAYVSTEPVETPRDIGMRGETGEAGTDSIAGLNVVLVGIGAVRGAWADGRLPMRPGRLGVFR